MGTLPKTDLYIAKKGCNTLSSYTKLDLLFDIFGRNIEVMDNTLIIKGVRDSASYAKELSVSEISNFQIDRLIYHARKQGWKFYSAYETNN
jgi:hypothetical protein